MTGMARKREREEGKGNAFPDLRFTRVISRKPRAKQRRKTRTIDATGSARVSLRVWCVHEWSNLHTDYVTRGLNKNLKDKRNPSRARRADAQSGTGKSEVGDAVVVTGATSKSQSLLEHEQISGFPEPWDRDEGERGCTHTHTHTRARCAARPSAAAIIRGASANHTTYVRLGGRLPPRQPPSTPFASFPYVHARILL